MGAVHKRNVELRPSFIPLIEEVQARLGDEIEFRVSGGTAWVLIPGLALEISGACEPGSGGRLETVDDRRPPFIAFAVTEDTPVRVKVVATANGKKSQVVSYSVLCYPGRGERPYYAQGTSPPRIVLPPKGTTGGTG